MASYSLKNWLQDGIAGSVCGLDVVFKAIAAATLIFSGPAKSCLALGLGGALFSSIIINLVFAAKGRFTFLLGSADIVIGAVLAQVVAQMSGLLTAETVIPTVMMAVLISALFIGCSSFLLGLLRLGNLVRFLPFPVINGIVAGIGWLVVVQGFLLLASHGGGWAAAGQVELGNQYFWAIFLGLLLLAIHLCQLFWLIPLILVLAMVLAQLGLNYFDMSLADGINKGYFNASLTPQLSFTVLKPVMLTQIDWQALYQQRNLFLTMPLISILMLLLNISGLEIIRQEKADLNHELKTQGFANILSGLLCALPCYMSPTSTLLNINIGAKSVRSTLFVALFCFLILCGSATIISYIPNVVISALLLYLGSVLINQFLLRSWFTLPSIDFIILVLIFLVIALYGVIAGTVCGIIVSCIVFVINYARADAVKYALTGSVYGSRVERSKERHQWLQVEGERIQIFKLQGFLFFGSAKFILDKACLNLAQLPDEKTCFFLFDFMHVTNIDSSAIYSFIQLQQLLAKKQGYLIFTQLTPALYKRFCRFGLFTAAQQNVKQFIDLDHGLEWCEDYLLQREYPHHDKTQVHFLADYWPQEHSQQELMQYLTKEVFTTEHLIFHQGDKSDGLYFVEKGDVAISQLNNKTGSLRLSRTGEGAVIGEMAFYLDIKRSATATTLTETICYRLSTEALQRMEKENPQLALQLHRSIIISLSSRLIEANEEINRLNE